MKKEHLFPVLVIALVVLALTHEYLLNGVPHEFITGEYKGTFEGDYDFTLELVEDWNEWRSIPLWSSTYSGPIAVFASNFHVFEQGAMYFLTRNLALSIKILQVLQILVAGLGMYFLANYLFGDRTAAVFSATIYMFTPFYLGHLLSYLHYTGVYMLAPFVYLLILRSLQQGRLGYMVLLTLVMTYSLLSHPQNVFIGGIFYALFFIMAAAHEIIKGAKEKNLRPVLKRVVTASILVPVLVFVLSAFLVLPTLIHDYPYMRTSWVDADPELVKVDEGHIGSHSQTILATITLQHWPWFQTPLKGGEYPPWYHMAAYIMPFVFASISLLIRCNWITAVFIVITVLSVQISLGVNGKPDLFSLASQYIPFFGMSRTPYSYISHAILVFCLFSSITFSSLSQKAAGFFKGPDGGRRTGWFLFALIILPYLISARYYGTSYNWTLIPAKQPRYLSQVWSWMDDNNKDRFRVIETCGIPTAMLLGQRMLPNGVDILERYHKKSYLARLLSLLGFKYIITPTLHSRRSLTFDRKGYTPPSVFVREDGMEQYYSALTTEYYFMYERLKKDPLFRLHRAGTKDVAIFENTLAFKNFEIYPARPVMVLGGTGAYDMLNLERFASGPLRPAPIFIAQSENLERMGEITEVSKELVLHNTDALDLFMLLNRDRIALSRPRPHDPALWETAIRSFGIQQPFPRLDHSIGNSLFGDLTFADTAVTTKAAGATAGTDFHIKRSGEYVVLLRTYGGAGMSNLSVDIDGTARFIDQKRFSGYRWIELYRGGLDGGDHSVRIRVEENRPVYLDSIAVVEASLIDPAGAMERLGGPSVTYIMNFKRFTPGAGTIATDLHVAEESFYVPRVRLSRFRELPPEGEIRLFIDDKPAGGIPLSGLGLDTEEFSLAPVRLGPGEHRITIRGLVDGVYFDLLALSTERRPPATAPHLEYRETGPSTYRVRSESTEDFFMVLNETFYPGWKAVFEGTERRPLVANMFMSGFVVPAGSLEFDVFYSNGVQKAGVLISLTGLSAILIILFAGAAWNLYIRKG